MDEDQVSGDEAANDGANEGFANEQEHYDYHVAQFMEAMQAREMMGFQAWSVGTHASQVGDQDNVQKNEQFEALVEQLNGAEGQKFQMMQMMMMLQSGQLGGMMAPEDGDVSDEEPDAAPDAKKPKIA